MGRSSKPKPLIDEVKTFVRWHLGRDAFAPHTGQDWPAWCAFVHLVQCWTHGGGTAAIAAMQQTLLCAQPIHSVLRTFVQVIPAVGEWSHVAEIWPLIAQPLNVRQQYAAVLTGHTAEDARFMQAWERSVRYDDKNKPIPGSDTICGFGYKEPGPVVSP